MAYRFDAGMSRSVALSEVRGDAAGPGLHLSLEGGSHLAALSPMIAPTSLSLSSAHDFSVSSASVTPHDYAIHVASPFARGMFSAPDGDNTAASGPVDTVPGDNTSTITLNVTEGQAIVGTIDAVGIGGVPPAPGTDADWYQVTLDAGTSYEFHMTPADADPTTGPDFRLTLYDADGNIVGATSDGGGKGEAEELHVTAASSGTYFISVDNFTPADLGDYTISGNIDSSGGGTGGTPLAAINWGGNDCKMDDGVDDGVTHIKVYYGQAGEVFGSPDDPVASVGWDDFAKAATFVAFQQYEHVCNVVFEEVTDSADADWILAQTVTAPALLGQMRPPGEENEGVGDFNKAGFDYDEASCQQGGYSYITFIHEFGHGMGMAHPHDTGGGSEVMHGVTGDVATGFTTGDFGLNQGVYTTMSYNDGWPDGPEGTSDNTAYGYQGTLMALDVAMMQIKYGANTSYHTGDDVYEMPFANEPGTMYACIWDADGNDTIKAQGNAVSTIDLRSATLQYEEGGGGWISHTDGIYGGFTIADGVVIENADGAKGDDSITGNDAANHLTGGGGRDVIAGGAGADTIEGQRGIDTLTGGDDADIFVFGENSTHRYHKADTIGDLDNADVIDLGAIDADTITDGDQGFTLVHHFHGVAGELLVKYVAGLDSTRIAMDTDGDGDGDMVIFATGNHGTYDNFVL